jgi:DNA-directed RNA polymerase subunit beta'
MSTNNILSPAHGKPIIVPTQDIVLGIYYMTKERPECKGEGKVFSNPDEVRIAYDTNEADLHARIKVRIDGELVETTVGRIILWEVVPKQVPFSIINKVMNKSTLGNLIDYTYRVSGEKETVLLADRVKNLGYRYATQAGVSMCIDNMLIPPRKEKFLDEANKEVQEVMEQYTDGLITDGERYNKVIDIWSQVTEKIADAMLKQLGTEEVAAQDGKKLRVSSMNPIFMMADSGARGSAQQIRQLAGMRGLMAKPSGEIIETPITANFREGLTVLQYFTSTHGAR